MASERIKRRIDAFLDEADSAATAGDWSAVAEKARAVLAIDAGNEDARAFLKMAEANGARAADTSSSDDAPQGTPVPPLPASFAGGRYRVLRLLGKGARKRVYLARDERLGREVALAVIPAEGLSPVEKERVLREAQAMARIGGDPHLVSIFDIGEDGTNLFTVQEFMSGGDVATLLALTPGPSRDPSGEGRGDGRRGPSGLAVERTLGIAKDVCRGLAAVHAAGIVHRDLKPANIFIGADGGARVGDLGLATNAGVDRLTQQGTMLGTVSYMPPEQALGGDVSPKADLYSFGAMLYEMVTGRPPFVGDDPTAVISQHINTPPVAPSWVTEHCPPALEEVILRLLAKDPGKRPASAAEVLAALEKVDPSQKSASHSDSNALDRLATGVFVGREKELERLRKAFDEAFAGRGGLVMLVGEPGIGKTRTTQELETYARMRGATVLWGRTHESSGAPPYWPWLQVGNQWAVANPELLGELGLGAEVIGELSRIFPVLKLRPGFVEPLPDSEPEAARFRLFDAYSTFLRAIAARTPLVVALDDLHWADRATLLLLQHAARELSRSRLLIVGNYRDTDITRQSALTETLASLNRESGFERVVLRGLSRVEVADYIRAKAHVEPKREVLDRIYEETEGNAFFLSEVVNLMAEEGTLSKESVSEIAIPDGVREALGRRLNRLSPETNELLQVATIIGREFNYDTLTLLGDRSEDTLLRCIEESIEARVIEELPQPGRYRFTHAQMQETLLGELSTTRRVRLHGQVGEALERRWGARADDYASRLATHFLESATLTTSHAEKAIKYAILAAERAEAQSAWAQAAILLEAAVTTMDAATIPGDTCGLLRRLSRCERFAGEHRNAYRAGMQAFTRARDAGDYADAGTACLELARIGLPVDRRIALFDEAIALVEGLDEPRLLANLLLERVMFPQKRPLALLARNVARAELIQADADWPETRFNLANLKSQVARDLLDAESEESLLAERARLAARVSDPTALSFIQADSTGAAVRRGDLSQGLARTDASLQFATEHRLILQTRYAWTARASILEARQEDGLDEAISIALPEAWAELIVGHRARLAGLPEDSLSRVSEPSPAIIYAFWPAFAVERASAYFQAGRTDEAETLLNRYWPMVEEVDGYEPPYVAAMAVVTDLLIAMDLKGWARTVREKFDGWLPARFTVAPTLNLDRARGALAGYFGDWAAAGRHYEAGRAICEREALPVELGRCYAGLADVAANRGASGPALQDLDRAAALFQKHGAKLYLDQVIAKKVEIQGITSEDMASSIVRVTNAVRAEHPNLSLHAAADGTVTLVFSDIENSTAQNEQLGDAKWMQLLRAHNAVIRRNLASFGGHEVKSMGDGFMLVFSSPVRAVQYAAATQGELATAAGLEGVRVRMGIHVGDAVREAGDFFGREVNYAARVAACAAGGEIVVSQAIRDRVVGQFTLGDARAVSLKGLAGEHQVYAVRVDGPNAAPSD